ncbi:Gfo/Idh/MocA family oxidoreductase [Acrocarpospora macrocephala]|uniref:Oxidoreductase n=1 Tax=Acrocarpospora macrocephala TaxID=150177 RepID=A0A5M3WFP5_9ACTN|nr:Gfo/Idh/MocA family oxidoreductase [Acrocarpospora macrocephala]GES06912.1 oxidoreductase [Acrocarpospora macrocephala]
MLRIGVIGLGDIAAKAYLPVLAATPGLDLRLCTRDPRTLRRMGDAYRVSGRFSRVDDLIADGIDAAFVHAATAAHVEIVSGLLDAGVHVFVDKPLAYHFVDAEKLVRLARLRERSLMVGFNRRYAPAYVVLAGLPRDLVIMQKNRANLAEDPRVAIFDDFIHVVDTLRFLAPGEVTGTRIRTRVVGGLLEHVVLELEGDGFTALGIMSRVSGAAEETCETMGGGIKRRVLNLGDVVDFTPGETLVRRPDWTPVSRQRGIEQACHTFLDAVGAGRLLDADDALETHLLCEQIVTQEGSQG